MAFGPVGNFAVFGFLLVIGFIIGVNLGWIVDKLDLLNETENSESNDPQVSTNAVISYLTLVLAPVSIVSQWPPEGQEMPSKLSDFVFFSGVLVTAFIAGRLTKLIARLELTLVQ